MPNTTLTRPQLINIRDKTLIYYAELERLEANFKEDQADLHDIFSEVFWGRNLIGITINFKGENTVLVTVESSFRSEVDRDDYEFPLEVCTSANSVQKYRDKQEEEKETAREAAEQKAEDERERAHYEYLKQKFEPKDGN